MDTCMICGATFVYSDPMVLVMRSMGFGQPPETAGAVHLWHLSSLPSVGGGV